MVPFILNENYLVKNYVIACIVFSFIIINLPITTLNKFIFSVMQILKFHCQQVICNVEINNYQKIVLKSFIHTNTNYEIRILTKCFFIYFIYRFNDTLFCANIDRCTCKQKLHCDVPIIVNYHKASAGGTRMHRRLVYQLEFAA